LENIFHKREKVLYPRNGEPRLKQRESIAVWKSKVPDRPGSSAIDPGVDWSVENQWENQIQKCLKEMWRYGITLLERER
jgi:hypothetical protein